ncbi:MAG: aldehyde dehydrogenase [Leptolyngbya sp. SIO3F4]|nr:aldehyde dehydrogenase [Leptolyngbya sp. SIO3F4]
MSDLQFIPSAMEAQRAFFRSGKTRPVSFRKEQLRVLRDVLQRHESRLFEALHVDLRKPNFESFITETGFLIREINEALRHVDLWAKPERVRESLLNFPSRSRILAHPYGTALVISPWNYPLMLGLSPAVGAMAAGNTVLLKPSEMAVHTAQVLEELVNEAFDPAYFRVVQGNAETSQALIDARPDYVFFTGSPRVGSLVMQQAAQYLIPVTLELGGKSPCIVDETANISLAGKRIAYGKFLNAGQTCITPDFVVVHKSKETALVEALTRSIQAFYSSDPAKSPDYGRIINEGHWKRLVNYLQDGEVLSGGNHEASERYIEPTLLRIQDLETPIMNEEIFGPILPICTYETEQELESILARNPNPLAFYVFSQSRKHKHALLEQQAFGGAMVNDTIEYLINGHLPFGGIGKSGMGRYHGKFSFDAFSHRKAVMEKSSRIDLPLKYPPFNNKLAWMRRLFRWAG